MRNNDFLKEYTLEIPKWVKSMIMDLFPDMQEINVAVGDDYYQFDIDKIPYYIIEIEYDINEEYCSIIQNMVGEYECNVIYIINNIQEYNSLHDEIKNTINRIIQFYNTHCLNKIPDSFDISYSCYYEKTTNSIDMYILDMNDYNRVSDKQGFILDL